MKDVDGVTDINFFKDGGVISFNYRNRLEYSGKLFSINDGIIIRDANTIYPRMSIKREVDNKYPHMFTNPTYFCVGTPMQLEIFQTRNNFDISKWFGVYGLPNLCALYYWEKYGIFPFGEYSHGDDGIYESICDQFNISKKNITFFKSLLSSGDININEEIRTKSMKMDIINVDSLSNLSEMTKRHMLKSLEREANGR